MKAQDSNRDKKGQQRLKDRAISPSPDLRVFHTRMTIEVSANGLTVFLLQWRGCTMSMSYRFSYAQCDADGDRG